MTLIKHRTAPLRFTSAGRDYPSVGLEHCLQEAFSKEKVTLIPYLTAGYPTLEGAREVVEEYIEAGADVVEIGVPFSDPIADGPTIRNTVARALENGANLDYCLDLAAEYTDTVPVVLLIYCNNVFACGVENFLHQAAAAGVSGLVIPDLLIDEGSDFREMAEERGISVCPLVAPTSTNEHLEKMAKIAKGFVYCASVAGVTGVREKLSSGAVELLRRVREQVSVPVALGFGIGSPDVAVEAAGEADGVIIGSKLMQLVQEGGPQRADEWLREVREALSGVEAVRDKELSAKV